MHGNIDVLELRCKSHQVKQWRPFYGRVPLKGEIVQVYKGESERYPEGSFFRVREIVTSPGNGTCMTGVYLVCDEVDHPKGLFKE